jgi:hypothetical protein
VSQSQHQSDGIVAAGVGINNEFHVASFLLS